MPFTLYIYLGAFVTYCDPILVLSYPTPTEAVIKFHIGGSTFLGIVRGRSPACVVVRRRESSKIYINIFFSETTKPRA